MDCPLPSKLVLPRFYPTWSLRTRSSMRIQNNVRGRSRLVWAEGNISNPRFLIEFFGLEILRMGLPWLSMVNVKVRKV